MEKQIAWSFIKNSASKDKEKAFVKSEPSYEEVHSKKGGQLNNNKSLGSIVIEQIQDLVANAIKEQLGGDVCKTHLYIKPYTKRVDALYMPRGYQPPKFQKFDGDDNLKQHVAHFIETCNNAGTNDDQW